MAQSTWSTCVLQLHWGLGSYDCAGLTQTDLGVQIQAAVDSACGDYTVTNSTISFVPTLLALPSSEFVITQP